MQGCIKAVCVFGVCGCSRRPGESKKKNFFSDAFISAVQICLLAGDSKAGFHTTSNEGRPPLPRRRITNTYRKALIE